MEAEAGGTPRPELCGGAACVPCRTAVSLRCASASPEVMCSAGVGWGRSPRGCCRVPSGRGRSCWSRGASADGGWQSPAAPGGSLNTRWGWQPAHPAHTAPSPGLWLGRCAAQLPTPGDAPVPRLYGHLLRSRGEWWWFLFAR